MKKITIIIVICLVAISVYNALSGKRFEEVEGSITEILYVIDVKGAGK